MIAKIVEKRSHENANRIKIWDLRTMQCMQTLEARDFAFSTMCVDPVGPVIFTAGAFVAGREFVGIVLMMYRTIGKEWRVWKSVMAGDNNVATNSPVKEILYNQAFSNVVVATGRDVRLLRGDLCCFCLFVFTS